ncbi:MAG TPA: Hsp70 family protein, partial [Candidatus Sulfotelmatobacter sp.]|nr:Hsp70 family protein [Candidatus Sulfotelmatobacter sp.]
MAVVEPAGGRSAKIVDVPVHQVRRAGEVGPEPLLPSCIYLPGEHELPADAIRVPWDAAPKDAVGEFARWQGARVPGRLVVSAKSWLCHAGVDRSAPILPWGASPDVDKISPVEASARLLAHMARSWDFSHPEAPFVAQEVILTVPASFDEVARALTVEAARQAGLTRFTLVEEPQAAFYDFTARHRRDLARALKDVSLVLVVDVGGGTSDFTLVQVQAADRGPALRRIAVGEHILLGGDNMDAALARMTEARALSGGRKLSPTQWTQLVQASRVAKEALLGAGGPDHYHLSIAGEGSRLVGSTLSAQLSRADVEEIVLEGFFPTCGPGEVAGRAPRVALRELGLPYASDPAITRQLAAFLRAHAGAGLAALGETNGASRPCGGLPRPDAILLNGGVFNATKLAARLVEVVSAWWPEAPPIRLLRHGSLELAVARGAAYYGLVRRGLGRRIGGGAAHAFYVGLEKTGEEQPMALCVIPRGHEEGKTVDVAGRTFQLTLGRPVQFPLFTTPSDRRERVGDVVAVGEELSLLPPIHALLNSAAGNAGQVPVHLRATLTEIGTLELWCVSDVSDERWRLEFELRGSASPGAEAVIESMPPGFGEARASLDQIFGRSPKAAAPGAEAPRAKDLWRSLEQTLGPRQKWTLPVLRELWGGLLAGLARRRRSADHERVFFQLLGYSLRPGFGYPLDDWRCEQSAQLFGDGVQFTQEKRIWSEFWVMWRRMAGGLSEARHLEFWSVLKPHLEHRLSPTRPKHAPRPKGVQPEGLDEMVRLAAALEHLPPGEKIELGAWIAARLRDPT